MAMHLVSSFATLVQKRQLEQSPHIRALACQGYEERHVTRVVLDALAIRVEVYRPRIPTDHERVGGDVLANSHPLGERVASDLEFVGPIDGLGDGARGGDRRWW